MSKHKRRPQHCTLTQTAQRAANALDKVGILAHPGVISPKGGSGSPRITVVPEPNRVRIAISSHGHQEILLYGAVEPVCVLAALRGEFGPTAVTVRGDVTGWQETESA